MWRNDMLTSLTKAIFFLLLCEGPDVSSFILDTSSPFCFPEFPCTCVAIGAIGCKGSNLTEVPLIPDTGSNRSLSVFDLSFNDISDIPADAFVNISSIRVINMDDNQISLIDADAFSGLEDSLGILDLQRNQLTSLSDAFLRLPNLLILELEGNPISILGPAHLSALGRSLRVLSLSLSQFYSWPAELHYLVNLSRLRISDIPFSNLPLDAFSPLATSLRHLEIRNSTFTVIPSAVCHLTNLNTLVYDYNLFTQHPMMEPCREPIAEVFHVTLEENNLDFYPQIQHTFTNITFFNVVGNPNLYFIGDEIYNQSVGGIMHLDISANGFERIPSAVRCYSNLEQLNASFNFIKTIEYGDLGDLQNLKDLELQGNPLVFIDLLAFKTPSGGVLPIANINLDLTSLGNIPEAVAGLPYLSRVRISGKQIECSCAMRYLKHWTHVIVEGNCEFTAEPLQTFISGELQKCL